jgi:50S ribosomal protein L16 3-hydroxylase
MDITLPLALLGGLSPQTFMKQYWQKKPLLIRQAIPGLRPPVDRNRLFELAALEDVESRLVQQTPGTSGQPWQMRKGPFTKRALPTLKTPAWTLLVQGMDLHDDGVHDLLKQFRFVPDARLDDLMISFATDGGGVGPHFDSYDVFLLQAHGQRRWRIGQQKDLRLQEDVPLKILAHFEPEQEFVLEPGDMLYLPPRYAHDGIAEGECMTYSVGFRAPGRGELAQELLQRLAEDAAEAVGETLYRDPRQAAVSTPAALPAALLAFAQDALQAALDDPQALARAMGEYLTEPKAHVWFDHESASVPAGQVVLDRRTRMLYDEQHVFINGEAYRAAGKDALLIRQLADERFLAVDQLKGASSGAKALLRDWAEAGWLHGV